ncbi:MAG: hypothetical protein ACRDF7_01520 [Candidatus Limnocylindrales bacterium]
MSRVTSGRPDLRRGLGYGLALALPFAAAWAVAEAILDIGAGLLVLASVTGWLTGTAVALGAEPGSLRRRVATVRLAVVVCLATWPVATVGAWLLSRFVLQGSDLSFAERIASTPLLDYVGPQFVPFGPLELAALAFFGWLGSR